MLDFRTIDPAGVAWTIAGPGGRGGPRVVARVRENKVVVQTPTCPVRVDMTTTSAGMPMYRVDFALLETDPAHSEFLEWVRGVERRAAESLVDWRGSRSLSTTTFGRGDRHSMRLTAFSDTLAFDAGGKVSADLVDATTAAAVLELQGAWNTDAKWGVRWKIVQLKFDTQPHECPAPVPLDVEPAGRSRLGDPAAGADPAARVDAAAKVAYAFLE